MNRRFKDIFITGERIQQLADITILPEPTRQFRQILSDLNIKTVIFPGDMHSFTVTDKSRLAPIKKAQTIFVYTHLVEAFFRVIVPNLEKPVYLITHNSDEQIDERFSSYIENEKISHWYGQNVALKHRKLTAIPIGIANSQWAHGQTELFTKIVAQNPTKNRMLYMNFNPYTNPDERLPIYNHFKDNPLVSAASNLSHETYLNELASHFFCISPPGNGLDCHRIWECLYLGVIPIVIQNPGMNHFRDLPISFIENWKQVDKSFLETEFKRINKLRYSAAKHKLDINYWAEQISTKQYEY